MKFTTLWELINSEGSILSVVESEDEDVEKERLYVKAICLKGECQIYAKTNDIILEMFFQGRISVKEMFLLRDDEDYILETKNKFESVFISDAIKSNIINSIECGDSAYYSIPEDMRLVYPFVEVLQNVRRDWSNGIGAVSESRCISPILQQYDRRH